MLLFELALLGEKVISLRPGAKMPFAGELYGSPFQRMMQNHCLLQYKQTKNKIFPRISCQGHLKNLQIFWVVKKMRTVATIQARMNSTTARQGAKKSHGKTTLWWQISRLKESLLLDDIVVATTNNPADNEIVECSEPEN